MTRSTDDQITLLRCLVCGPILGDLSVQIFFCVHLSECHTVTICTSHLPLIALFIQWEISQNSGSFFQTIHNLPLEMSLHLSVFFERKVHFLVDGFFLGLNLLQVLCKCACHLFLAHVHFLGFEFFQQFFCRHWFSHQISANCLLCYSSTTQIHVELISISQ